MDSPRAHSDYVQSLERGDGREFSLRPSVLDLGAAYLSSIGLAEVALPHMEALVNTVLESSSVSVLDGPDVESVFFAI